MSILLAILSFGRVTIGLACSGAGGLCGLLKGFADFPLVDGSRLGEGWL